MSEPAADRDVIASDLEALRTLPHRLLCAGYVDAVALRGLLSVQSSVAGDLEWLAPHTATLVELFYLRRAIARERVDGALEPAMTDALLRLGVLVQRDSDNTGAVSTMDLVALPILGQIALVPSPEAAPTAFFGNDSAVLLSRMLAVRGAALIVGAGPGLLALRAAQTASRVLAVESDPVASACAELNVAMYGASNITLRTGHYDQALTPDDELSRRCDSVLVAAPTIPAPMADGSLAGPEVLGRIMERLPEILGERGVAQLVGVWHGDAQGPVPALALAPWTTEHSLRVVMTVSSRQSLATGSPLLEAVCQRVARAASCEISEVRQAHQDYLTRRRASHLYLVSMVVSRSDRHAGVESTRHFKLPGGAWQR